MTDFREQAEKIMKQHYKACWEDSSGRPLEEVECVCPIRDIEKALTLKYQEGIEEGLRQGERKGSKRQ